MKVKTKKGTTCPESSLVRARFLIPYSLTQTLSSLTFFNHLHNRKIMIPVVFSTQKEPLLDITLHLECLVKGSRAAETMEWLVSPETRQWQMDP